MVLLASLAGVRESGRTWDRSIRGNSLPVPIPPGWPFEKYTYMGSRRASSDISIWTWVLHETRKQYCCSQEHTVKGKHNAQSVTCAHKLSLSHLSITKKLSEPISTQTCGPCDVCRLPYRLRGRSCHDATEGDISSKFTVQCSGEVHETSRRPSYLSVARHIPNTLQPVE